MIQLDRDYVVAEQLGVLLGYAGLVLIVAGEFTRHAAPRLKDIAMVAEGVGWISFVLTQIVLTQRAAERNVDCTLYGNDCPTSLSSEAWIVFGPYVIDVTTAAAATLLGWGAAKIYLHLRPTEQD